ncbi:MAG TPA: ribonuclease J [Alphaproteobacteria bacterium]|nr:ribonuclease J [Alphaproteobacteria bacterium]
MSKKQLAALPLGGVGEIGMNMMLYECDGDYIVVDTGVSFGDERSPGVNILVPDTRYIRDHVAKGGHLKGVFITHAHEDHIGGIGYLWDDFAGAPVYVSPFARKSLEAKLQELGITPAKGQVITVEPRKQYQAGGFSVEYVMVAHSIPECFALAIRSPHGTIVHTADYKFDDEPPFGHKTDEKRLAEIGNEGVLAVFGDSTNAMKQTPSGSEGPLAKNLAKYIKAAPNRIFFAAFASNIGRILMVAQTAAECGRKVCFLGRTVNKMLGFAKELGYQPQGLANWMVSPDELKNMPRDKVLIFASGTQGEIEASLTRLAAGQEVRGLRIAKGDTVIMSSKMIPGNERGILNVINNLYTLGADVMSELTHDDIHVSGHASRPEIEKMYGLLKPQYVIPVHGEAAHLFTHGEIAKSMGIKHLSISNGKKLVLGPDEPHTQQHAYPHGVNYIDGLHILDHDTTLIKERRKMANEGMVSVSLAVKGANKEWVSDLAISTRGVIDERAQGALLKKATNAALKAMEVAFPDGIIDDRYRAADVITQTVKRAFKLDRGKQPTIMVQVVEV